ncbi:TlpA disulfide reductase family protein [Methylomonas sp. LWB]|uniref:TlpA disulfide reductase family protein n=1 Tax=Methylomonas sp. LWB TaxID=1905845 RepID=UPI0020C8DC57|nr:TlpA disulfide reductase family protein [Methylomonas sp. LWB]
MKKPMTLKTALFALLLFGGAAGIFQLIDQTSLAPDHTFTSLNGEQISLRQLHGSPVLVTFWATDCASCLSEIPTLINWHHRFANRGLKIIAVAMYYDPPNRVLELTRERKLPYDVVLDVDGSGAADFGNVNLTPTTFLIDSTGKLILHQVGMGDLVELEARISTL